ncbi:MAG: LytTR family DNA-binding domain-containing protein [Syntrophomonas sp.]|uniref:LytR/AlgR family response regulator transcription factor n=1 Tax=Syntrophomonas sp. TaxID=2053627 RepID=UPI002637DC1C|nr:LytTR family DNA-binding domain-containing protein [Syntrophomonas sp.]MDD2509522.1 LytTR family DNA-binding domain-containing protein [Syntrophomonas sp.]MDD3878393.1 LytTR family DNA-binding domain-containing protein [Syntrophomonas sp.]MDD4625508.1 LytTR family DNA-binding domain-containing protein [Syntrophomonas sp.]
MKILLLEDEEYSREFIRQLLEDIPVVGEVMATASAEEAIALAQNKRPDLIFLDIELEGSELNGLQVAQNIYSFNKEAYIVFLTAYSKYAIDSFEVHPYNYILKPIKVTRFREAVEEIAEKIEQKDALDSDILVIKYKNEIHHIRPGGIIFIEIQNNLSFIHTKEGIFESYLSLAELEAMLDRSFLRVHKSFIVNLKQIKQARGIFDRSYEIEFYGYEQKALMSRYKYPEYKRQMGL